MVRSGTLLTTGEAARHCQVSVAAFRNWLQAGLLTACRTPGGHYRIELEALQQFLRAHGMRPYPEPLSDARVLIADDEPAVVEMLVEVLSAFPRPLRIETASDGYEALIKVGAFSPTAVILDALMPRLDGIEACRRLKGGPAHSPKILGITGYPEMIQSLIEAGVDACLVKPLDLGLFRQEVERLLTLAEAEEGSTRASRGSVGPSWGVA